MNNYVKLILRTDIMKKDGTYPLYLRLTFSRKLKYMSLFKSVHIHEWDDENECVRHNHADANSINLLLKAYLKRANDIVLEYEIKGKPLTFFDFEALFKNNKTSSFYEYVERVLENNSLTHEYSAQSLRSYKAEISKMKRFKKNLNFNEITIPFLQHYEGYMRNELENQVNTIHKSLKTMRTFINRAIQDDMMDENIFKKYKLRTEEGHREFLTESELKEIELLAEQPLDKAYKKILNIFLFTCYTGLRFRDIRNLKHGDIHEGMIRIRMHKTKKIIAIPLINKALALIEPGALPTQPVFNVPCNQVANRRLKEVLKQTSIQKMISFHCARHTFATQSLTLGIPVEVVSKLLGHSNIRTTQIYARVVDNVKIKEMKKWNY